MVEFTHESGRTVVIPGFWDGGDTWRVRFTATEPGCWAWRSRCATPLFTHGYLAGISGQEYIAYVTARQCDVMLFLPVGTSYWGQWMNPFTGEWSDCDLSGSNYGCWMRWSAITPGDGDWVLVVTCDERQHM